MNSLVRGIKTVQQVGLLPVLQVALYRFGLVTGHYRRMTKCGDGTDGLCKGAWISPAQPLDESPVSSYFREHPELDDSYEKEAELILSGKCRIFGNQLVDIVRNDLDSSRHWTDFEFGRVLLPEKDIKFIWEPARLGWVFSLARAKAAGKNPLLGQRAWTLLETFFTHNPVNCGPNWMNGQEVALRLLALVFFHEVFENEAGMPENWEKKLAQAVIDHARRIPPTLVYAKSQQNNHLLVEAAGLYTAGVFLPEQPDSLKWKETGWTVFHRALDDQIRDDGTYTQYSTNYHRLMLQIALWVKAISLRAGEEFPERSSNKLAAATQWLSGLTAPETGRVPNYGHNDGAYIIPLTASPFRDFRPVVQSARHFFQPGSFSNALDEMPLWFEWLAGKRPEKVPETVSVPSARSYRKLADGAATAFLFAPQFNRRPGQADLLHTELWWKGEPLLLDAGTFQYNADPPWENALAQTKVHNTITVNGSDQMLRGGRFLWLDWPKVKLFSVDDKREVIVANHDGYRRYGVIHERLVSNVDTHTWRVVDYLTRIDPTKSTEIDVWLNWLFPLLDWKVTPTGLQFSRDDQKITVSAILRKAASVRVVERQVVKAGELTFSSSDKTGQPEEIVNLGWFSPTYAIKEPAISYRLHISGRAQFSILTEFQVC